MLNFDKHPLRKPKDQINLKPDAEVLADEASRRATAELLTKERDHPLVSRVAQSFPEISISEANDLKSIPRNFSLGLFGHNLCKRLSTKLIGAAHGRIDNILLTVPPNYKGPNRKEPNDEQPVDPLNARHLTTLMGLMDSHTRFTLLCHQNQIETINQWLLELGICEDRVSICLSVFDYTIWAQDAYVNLVAAGGETILCEGVNFSRSDDMSIADDVAAQSDCRALQSYLYFQGGNVLAARDYALIGADYVKKNIGRPYLVNEDEVLKHLHELFGMKVISVGRSEPIPRKHRANRDGSIIYLSGLYQPIFHIDMYVTPTGVICKKSEKEICMVGRPSLARKILGEPAGEYDFDVYFEETEIQLSKYFEIVQLPLYPTKLTYKDYYHHLTYNNSVLENYVDSKGRERRVVYMPTYAEEADKYGFPRRPRKILDNAAKEIWQSIGFEVRRMDSVEDLAVHWGAVHCITKELRRSAYKALANTDSCGQYSASPLNPSVEP